MPTIFYNKKNAWLNFLVCFLDPKNFKQMLKEDAQGSAFLVYCSDLEGIQRNVSVLVFDWY